MSDVVVVEYDPAWPGVFEDLRAHVWPAVSDIASAVEHVGSTSVVGLAAKPVIDMDVVVPPQHLLECIARLEVLGYKHRGDLGVPSREAFRCPPGLPKHHLYLCSDGSPALANHLVVRDRLRSEPRLAKKYGVLKKDLAARFSDDIDAYIEGKTGFLLQLLQEAGFEDDSLEEIERINRRM